MLSFIRYEMTRAPCALGTFERRHMLNTLREILQENWQWRSQIMNLAVIDLHKTVRGAVLGWIWLLVKPVTYIAVFWFALELGLRASSGVTEYPYILWLSCGLIPWFFMSDLLNTGANIYRRYPFLVNRIHFPLSSISLFYALSQFIIFLMLMALLLIACVVKGYALSVYALQLVPVSLIMLVFWTMFSVMVSGLSALSKDFLNLLRAATQPLFWISGVIYNLSNLPHHTVTKILAFNPVTFFCEAFRACLCDKYWLWDKPSLLVPFLVAFVLTLVVMLWNYKKLRKDVADVL